MKNLPQKAMPNDFQALIEARTPQESLSVWIELYFQFEVTTSPRSRKEQRRDLKLFLDYMLEEVGSDDLKLWSPRLSASFLEYLKSNVSEQGGRRWSDRSVNRTVAHLKTLAKWIHKFKPFPLGCPTDKLKSLPAASLLNIDRALSNSERMRILDAADLLLKEGGRSKDRSRHKKRDGRPRRKGYRPFRNRAIVYCLIETGMRRAAVTKVNLADADFANRIIPAEEKGGGTHDYRISRDGMAAIREYVDSEERKTDFGKWGSPALFLSPATNPHGDGRLTPQVVNNIWREVCRKAGVEGKTPHSARHAMGKHIIKKTGNISAVQRQLGHKNAAYSMQYARIGDDELRKVLDER